MSRSRKCLFVGYPQGKNGWKLNDLETGGYFVSRDVKFYETNFPFAHNTPSTLSSPMNIVALNFDYIDDSFDDILGFGVNKTDGVIDGGVVHERVIATNPTSSEGLLSTSNEEFQPTGIVSHKNGGNEFAANAPCNNVSSSIGFSNFLREEAVATPIALDDDQRGKGKRIRYPSTKLRDFVTNTIQKVSPSFSPPSSTSSQTSGFPIL